MKAAPSSVFFGEKSPETHSLICLLRQGPRLGLLFHPSECFHWVNREDERRKDGAVGVTPLRQEVHTSVSKQERQESPTHGMPGGESARLVPRHLCRRETSRTRGVRGPVGLSCQLTSGGSPQKEPATWHLPSDTPVVMPGTQQPRKL